MSEDLKGLEERVGKLEVAVAAMNIRRTIASRRPVELTDAICSDCKKPCKVPFVPTTDRPLYCKECFATRRAERR